MNTEIKPDSGYSKMKGRVPFNKLFGYKKSLFKLFYNFVYMNIILKLAN